MGAYKVENGLPLNPKIIKGKQGRGSLRYWGPNHAILAVFVRFKKIQVLVKLIDEKQYELPWVKIFFQKRNDK